MLCSRLSDTPTASLFLTCKMRKEEWIFVIYRDQEYIKKLKSARFYNSNILLKEILFATKKERQRKLVDCLN